ncbi:MAG: DUF3078 domain-containing protein [Bacteroidales bacterium]|nr:DUF3078 domain-containing protein [Bacteroidales bacterium]
MKKILATVLLLLCTAAMYAQEQPASDSAAVEKPKYWNTSLLTQLGFSQVSLIDWAAGGFGSVSLNSYLDFKANYAKNKSIWENRAQFGYGFIQNMGEGFKKSDDRIIIDSKYGYKAAEKLYFSVIYNFRTQFTTGYKDKKGSPIVSNFFSPAYTSLGFGISYTPTPNISINFAPLTSNLVIVQDADLRSLYGNAPDQYVRYELGAQVKFDASVKIEDFKANTTLTLFSDYLNKPLNIKVNWDVNITAQLTKFLGVTLRTYLIYDDTIKHIDKLDAAGNPVIGEDGKVVKIPGVQFKEISGLSFTYTF